MKKKPEHDMFQPMFPRSFMIGLTTSTAAFLIGFFLARAAIQPSPPINQQQVLQSNAAAFDRGMEHGFNLGAFMMQRQYEGAPE